MSLNNNQQVMFAAENERFNLYFDLYIRKNVHKLLIYSGKWRRDSPLFLGSNSSNNAYLIIKNNRLCVQRDLR